MASSGGRAAADSRRASARARAPTLHCTAKTNQLVGTSSCVYCASRPERAEQRALRAAFNASGGWGPRLPAAKRAAPRPKDELLSRLADSPTNPRRAVARTLLAALSPHARGSAPPPAHSRPSRARTRQRLLPSFARPRTRGAVLAERLRPPGRSAALGSPDCERATTQSGAKGKWMNGLQKNTASC